MKNILNKLNNLNIIILLFSAHISSSWLRTVESYNFVSVSRAFLYFAIIFLLNFLVLIFVKKTNLIKDERKQKFAIFSFGFFIYFSFIYDGFNKFFYDYGFAEKTYSYLTKSAFVNAFKISDKYFDIYYLSFFVFISFLILSLIIYFLSKKIKIYKYISLLLVCFILFDFFCISKNIYKKFEPVTKAKNTENKPNVYFILADLFAGPKTMKGFYHSKYDFVTPFEEKGFHVFKNALSSASITGYSMPHFFMMDYYIKDGEMIDKKKFDWIWSYRSAMKVRKEFRKRGYEYIHVDDGSYVPCLGYEDLCLAKKSFPNLYDMKFMQKNFAFRIYEGKIQKDENTDIKTVNFLYKGLWEVYDIIKELPIDKKREPFFYYNHLSLPHPPYRFDENCNYLNHSWASYTTHNTYERQAICTSKLLDKYAQKIIENDPKALIFIQSDHGSHNNSQWQVKGNNYTLKQRLENFHIFSAYKFPKRCEKYLNEKAQYSVNNFRFAFSCIDDKKIDYLPHHAFHVKYLDRYDPKPVRVYEWKKSKKPSEIIKY